MRIMDKYNCKYCGRDVVLETDNDYVDVTRYDVDCACSDCYNNITLVKMDYDSTIETEWNEIQGNYLG